METAFEFSSHVTQTTFTELESLNSALTMRVTTFFSQQVIMLNLFGT